MRGSTWAGNWFPPAQEFSPPGIDAKVCGRILAHLYQEDWQTDHLNN